MKVKLTINCKKEVFEKASEVADVKVLEYAEISGMTIALISFKHPSQMYNLGIIQSKLENKALSEITGVINKKEEVNETLKTKKK